MNGYLDTAQAGLRWLQALPWLTLLLYTAPLLVLAAWKRIYPRGRLLLWLSLPCALAFALLVWQDLLLVVVAADLLVLVIAAVDLGTLPARHAFSAERQVARIASLRRPQRVFLRIDNHSRRAFRLEVRDDVPQELRASPEQLCLELAGRRRAAAHYDVLASRRGAFSLRCVYLRAGSRLGLWQRHLDVPVASEIHVYPDMQQLSEYAVLARKNRLSLMGVRRTRRVGQDNEFERLRDYALDDNYKHIDWRSTARRRKLTVKDFQTNHSQRVVFLVDCGRMMTNHSAGLSLLDHALNAMLMLSFVALRQGDAVGLVCFSDQIHSQVPVRGGMVQMNRLLHAAFDRFPRLVESRYDEAFLYLDTHCKKRSLVILISNLIDEVNANQVQRHLGVLVGRHLPLGVLLRDHRLFDAAEEPYSSDRALYRSAAAAEILTWRRQVLTDLQHRGVLALDAFPEDMTAPLVNRYLEIKARHLL